MAFGKRFLAAGKIRHQHERGRMNKPEQEFAALCQLSPDWLRESLGIIVYTCRFEAVRYQLANGVTLLPDFELIATETGQIVVVEVKVKAKNGRVLWEDDARVKIKVLAHEYPERRVVVAIREHTGLWTFEEIDP